MNNRQLNRELRRVALARIQHRDHIAALIGFGMVAVIGLAPFVALIALWFQGRL